MKIIVNYFDNIDKEFNFMPWVKKICFGVIKILEIRKSIPYWFKLHKTEQITNCFLSVHTTFLASAKDAQTASFSHFHIADSLLSVAPSKFVPDNLACLHLLTLTWALISPLIHCTTPCLPAYKLYFCNCLGSIHLQLLHLCDLFWCEWITHTFLCRMT